MFFTFSFLSERTIKEIRLIQEFSSRESLRFCFCLIGDTVICSLTFVGKRGVVTQ